MINILKKLYHHTTLGKYVIQKAIDLNFFYLDHIASDRMVIENRFRKRMGYKLDLKNPKTLNEKINWLKVFYRTSIHTQCADKYRVREYIKNKIGEEYLVPLYLMTENVKDLNPETLPQEPFIIKTNHDSSGGVVVKNKKEIDWITLREKFKKRLRRNYYHRGKEWQYRDIKPCVIVEKLLDGKDGGPPFDYKLHCFHGVVNMIQVDVGRSTDNHRRNWYNRNWEREPFKWSAKKGGKLTEPSDKEVERPENLDEMIRLTEILASDFPYVRVDWYDVANRLYFGELTFHHDGGTSPIYPTEWDRKLGDRLTLPNLPK